MEQHAADIKKKGLKQLAKMMAAMMANPSMSQEEQAKLTEQYTKEFQQELIQKILSDMNKKDCLRNLSGGPSLMINPNINTLFFFFKNFCFRKQISCHQIISEKRLTS